MAMKIGEIAGLYRYPVKSMAGEALDEADLGWHGLEGDRRLALRRLDERGGFPWLTATKLPELICFTPIRTGAEDLPAFVRTPEGEELALFDPRLAADISKRHGAAVEMTHLCRGIFDEASVSVITSGTIGRIAELVGDNLDVRRFRPNILVSSLQADAFAEDAWVGGVLSFGDGENAAAIGITNHDERCAMICFDPDSGQSNPAVLKAVVSERDNRAGVYGTVIRCGRLAVGQALYFTPIR